MVRLFIEPIATEEALREGATAEDRAIVEAFSSAHRRREVLAWRSIVRRELGSDCAIGYDEWGAPVVGNSDTHIGVSHCRDLVAVVISDSPCAVDVEERSRNFEGVSARYMTEQERAFASEEDWAAKVWCAKEALYKYYRRGNLDLKSEISIVGYSPTSQLIEAQLPNGLHKEVKVEVRGEHIVATIG